MALITISRKIGSGGHEIAERVAKRLSVALYDDKRLQDEALKLGIRRDDFKGLDQKAPGFFDQILSRKPEMYLALMEAVVYEVSRRGEGVVVGHGSQILLQDFHCALHVFIHAADELRIQRFMETQQMGREAAEKLISKNDHQREGFFRYAFQLELTDPALYDLTINTGKIVPELAAGMEAREVLLSKALPHRHRHRQSISERQAGGSRSRGSEVHRTRLTSNSQIEVQIGALRQRRLRARRQGDHRDADPAQQFDKAQDLLGRTGV